jgi:hypothetical protein
LLDDYEEGTWTPALTFETPGDLAITYAAQRGSYTRIGDMVICEFAIVTSLFTHTTASGQVSITGLPFAGVSISGYRSSGAGTWGGITKANYTDIICQAENGLSILELRASGSAQSSAGVTAADMPTGGNVALRFTIAYKTS